MPAKPKAKAKAQRKVKDLKPKKAVMGGAAYMKLGDIKGQITTP